MPSNTSPPPSTCAMICSIGPPGTNCVSAKLISMIPNSVGTISSSLRRMYAPMVGPASPAPPSAQRAGGAQLCRAVGVVPPEIEIAERVGRQRVGMLVDVEIGHGMGRLVPLRHPEAVGAQHPVERADGGGEILLA